MISVEGDKVHAIDSTSAAAGRLGRSHTIRNDTQTNDIRLGRCMDKSIKSVDKTNLAKVQRTSRSAHRFQGDALVRDSGV